MQAGTPAPLDALTARLVCLAHTAQAVVFLFARSVLLENTATCLWLHTALHVIQEHTPVLLGNQCALCVFLEHTTCREVTGHPPAYYVQQEPMRIPPGLPFVFSANPRFPITQGRFRSISACVQRVQYTMAPSARVHLPHTAWSTRAPLEGGSATCVLLVVIAQAVLPHPLRVQPTPTA